MTNVDEATEILLQHKPSLELEARAFVRDLLEAGLLTFDGEERTSGGGDVSQAVDILAHRMPRDLAVAYVDDLNTVGLLRGAGTDQV